ncbi:DUF6297 family protein [Rhodococcus sp. (in: high G+C Gram-positive bacteria)]|uniref:DUF6297 family protein n=1 Tax=Rhodococcus sp. TaxID=1831 RepID=UPI00388F280C
MALTEQASTITGARALRKAWRRFGRVHALRTDRAGTVVLSALGAYVVSGLVWWGATRPPTSLIGSLHTTAGRSWDATSWNPGWAWVVGAALLVAGIAAARALGPLTASTERAFWLLSTPVDRASMLRPGVVTVFAAGAGAGAAGGRLAAFAGTVEQWPPLTACGAVLGLGVAALALLVQARVLPTRTLPVVQILTAALGGAVAAVCATGTVVPVFGTWPPAAVVALPALAMCCAALLRCGRITAAELNERAEITAAARTSLIGLDPTLVVRVHDAGAWKRVAARRSRALPPGRTRALVRADLLRNLRRPSPFATTAVAVCAAWALGATTQPVVAGWVQLSAVYAATLVFSTGLRDLASKPDLRAMLGAADRDLYRPLMVVPACAAAAVTAVTAPVTGWSPSVSAIVAAGACVAVYRLRTRPATEYDGLVLETAVGQVPLDLIRQWMRGPDSLVAAGLLLALIL